MPVAQLSADFSYRSLFLADVLAGDDNAGAEWELFSYDTPIGDNWVPLEVVYCGETGGPTGRGPEFYSTPGELPEHERPIGDFPHLWGVGCGVLAKPALDALRDLLAPYVEFLPLVSKEGEFTAFKVLRFADALDRDKSKIDWFPQLKKDTGKPRVAREVRRYAFVESRLRDEVIFRLPEMPLSGPVFVTERFMSVVRTHSLRGFKFTHVWPPVDERQKFLQKRLRKRGRAGRS